MTCRRRREISLSQRYLNPEITAGISGLDLVAKTVVDGFIAGLHRSPDFGFSQEFAEYRAYNGGRRPAATSTGTSSPAPSAATSSGTSGETNTR